jgi:leader peptidase (prepilin peptidase) / N-methyltransferase
MVRIPGTIFAALLGLAFGSFLNVCLTRWPAGESILKPRSHCRACGRTLAWWENIPVVSWIALRGRCRTCGAWIGWRYPLVELAVASLWAYAGWSFAGLLPVYRVPQLVPFGHWNVYDGLGWAIGQMVFFWFLVAVAALDSANFWIPDRLTFPGIALGIAINIYFAGAGDIYSAAPPLDPGTLTVTTLLSPVLDVLIAALPVLLIRWTYKLIRKREGIGLGDAKLIAMIAAWLGLAGALLSFFIGVILGALTALILLALPRKSADAPGAGETTANVSNGDASSWALRKLPLGTFLCIGGIVSALWGQRILDAYFRWAGF